MYSTNKKEDHWHKSFQRDKTFHPDHNQELKLILIENLKNTNSKVLCEKAGTQPLYWG